MDNKSYTEIIDSITDLEQQLNELKTQLVRKNSEAEPATRACLVAPHTRWEPSCGEIYYTIEGGAIAEREWYGDDSDLDAFDTGLIFETEEDADWVLNRMKVLADMGEWAGDFGCRYAIGLDCDEVGNLSLRTIDTVASCPRADLLFESKEDAEHCVEAVGKDRIIKYYFGIDETEAE